jgi:hypothetical protein
MPGAGYEVPIGSDSTEHARSPHASTEFTIA